MSMDRSLKAGSWPGSTSQRFDPRRTHWRASLEEGDGKWDPTKPVTGLVKVGNRKLIVGGKAEKKDDAAAVPGAPAAKGSGRQGCRRSRRQRCGRYQGGCPGCPGRVIPFEPSHGFVRLDHQRPAFNLERSASRSLWTRSIEVEGWTFCV